MKNSRLHYTQGSFTATLNYCRINIHSRTQTDFDKAFEDHSKLWIKLSFKLFPGVCVTTQNVIKYDINIFYLHSYYKYDSESTSNMNIYTHTHINGYISLNMTKVDIQN